MQLTINHSTQYHYDVPASYALQQLRVRPQTSQGQAIIDWRVDLDGAKTQASFRDQHGNFVDLVEFLPGIADVTVTVTGKVETADTAGIAGLHELLMPLWFYLRQTDLTFAGELVHALTSDLPKAHGDNDAVATLHALSKRILEQVAYATGETSTSTTAESALKTGKGVCQDHTHIFLSAARRLGHPARYVSGYLMMNDRVDQDASHAWAEAHIDGLGWVGFDVSNAISPDERYIHIARGLDYRESAPTTGFIMGAERENLIVSLQVQQ